jgi:hypothetical protein
VPAVLGLAVNPYPRRIALDLGEGRDAGHVPNLGVDATASISDVIATLALYFAVYCAACSGRVVSKFLFGSVYFIAPAQLRGAARVKRQAFVVIKIAGRGPPVRGVGADRGEFGSAMLLGGLAGTHRDRDEEQRP